MQSTCQCGHLRICHYEQHQSLSQTEVRAGTFVNSTSNTDDSYGHPHRTSFRSGFRLPQIDQTQCVRLQRVHPNDDQFYDWKPSASRKFVLMDLKISSSAPTILPILIMLRRVKILSTVFLSVFFALIDRRQFYASTATMTQTRSTTPYLRNILPTVLKRRTKPIDLLFNLELPS